MRRLLLLAAVAALVWRFLHRRGARPPERVVVGFEDGSALELDPGAPEGDRLLSIARDTLAR